VIIFVTVEDLSVITRMIVIYKKCFGKIYYITLFFIFFTLIHILNFETILLNCAVISVKYWKAKFKSLVENLQFNY